MTLNFQVQSHRWVFRRSLIAGCFPVSTCATGPEVSLSLCITSSSQRFWIRRFGLRRIRRATPPGLVSVDELPPKWGLLEVKGARVRTLRKSEGHAVDNRKEIAVLLSVLRRIGSTAPKGIGIKCYTHGFSERSVLSIGQEETIAELLSGNLLEQFE